MPTCPRKSAFVVLSIDPVASLEDLDGEDVPAICKNMKNKKYVACVDRVRCYPYRIHLVFNLCYSVISNPFQPVHKISYPRILSLISRVANRTCSSGRIGDGFPYLSEYTPSNLVARAISAYTPVALGRLLYRCIHHIRSTGCRADYRKSRPTRALS